MRKEIDQKTSTAQVLIRRLATGLGPPGGRRATGGPGAGGAWRQEGVRQAVTKKLRGPWNSVRLAV